jgi:hypothetical protein
MENPMRVMVIVKASKESETGKLPGDELLHAMGKFNEELVNAGILLAAEGLQSSSKGKRVLFNGTSRTVVDGPFTETKELIAGFWLWQVKSMDEAVEWVKRVPNPHGIETNVAPTHIEIRPVFEPADFNNPEAAEQGERLKQRIAAQKG